MPNILEAIHDMYGSCDVQKVMYGALESMILRHSGDSDKTQLATKYRLRQIVAFYYRPGEDATGQLGSTERLIEFYT